jgi:hypothetical protein
MANDNNYYDQKVGLNNGKRQRFACVGFDFLSSSFILIYHWLTCIWFLFAKIDY